MIEKLVEQSKSWLVDEKKEDGFTSLHLACLNNHYEVVKLLIELGKSNVNVKNMNQQTALHLVIDRQHYDIVQLLLDNKSDVNVQNKDGDSPLHCLVRNQNLNHAKQYVIGQKPTDKVRIKNNF